MSFSRINFVKTYAKFTFVTPHRPLILDNWYTRFRPPSDVTEFDSIISYRVWNGGYLQARSICSSETKWRRRRRRSSWTHDQEDWSVKFLPHLLIHSLHDCCALNVGIVLFRVSGEALRRTGVHVRQARLAQVSGQSFRLPFVYERIQRRSTSQKQLN